MSNLLASTVAAAAENPAAPPAATPPAAPSFDAAAAAEIAGLCMAAGVPQLAAPLIREGATVDAAKLRIDGAKDIRAAVDLARKSCPQIAANAADAYIAAGTPIGQVRGDLFEKMAAVSAAAPIISQHQAGTGKIDVAAGWTKAVAKANARVTNPAARTG